MRRLHLQRALTAALACALACALAAPTVAVAQAPTTPAAAQPTRPAKSFCFRGQRIDRCERFMLVEFAGLGRIVGSEIESPPPVPGASPVVERQLPHYISGEIGLMVNRDSSSAFGATIGGGIFDDARRVWLKGRYRHWIGNGIAADFSAGPMRGHVDRFSSTGILIRDPRIGATFDGAIGVGDLLAVIGRADVLPAPGGPAWAFYGGGRLGSHAAVAGGVVGVIIIGLAIAALASAYS